LPDIPLLGEDAANARAAQNAPEKAPENTTPKVVEVLTAFLVIQTLAGETVLTDDINMLVTTARPPSRDETFGMLATATKDMQVEEIAVHSAETTITRIAEKQREAITAAQNAAIKAELERQQTAQPGARH
jgi:hypothetical protein